MSFFNINQPSYSQNNLFLGFLLGALASAIVGFIFFRIQKRQFVETEKRLLRYLELILQQSEYEATTMSTLSDYYEEMVNDVKSVKSVLEDVFKLENKRGRSPRYSRIVEFLVQDSIEKILSRKLKLDKLSIDFLCNLHREIFSKIYPNAGKLRKTQVWIGYPGTKMEKAIYVPPSSDEARNQIVNLLNDWNQKHRKLLESPIDKKIKFIAEFHYRFVSIHPFQDGNGTIARLITYLQIKELTGEVIYLKLDDSDRKKYTEGLKLASGGNYSGLIELFREAIWQNNNDLE